jgi:hypothetical protein
VADHGDRIQLQRVEQIIQPCDRSLAIAMPREIYRVAQSSTGQIRGQGADPVKFVE